MKYKAASIAIVGIWIMSSVIIFVREDISTFIVLFYALFNTIILSFFGFRSPAHPESE